MEEHFNSGIAFFNKTKIKEGAVKIEESIARQSNILVTNDKDRNHEHDKGNKYTSNVHSRQCAIMGSLCFHVCLPSCILFKDSGLSIIVR